MALSSWDGELAPATFQESLTEEHTGLFDIPVFTVPASEVSVCQL